jgi:probable F420-dependent oxidoreductase
MELGRVGIWTSALDRQPAAVVREAVAEIESLGYGTLWVGEAARREAFANAALLLSASTTLGVATGIANIWVRDPMAMASGQRTLSEAWDGRFLLGVGVSHDPLVSPRGHRYERPLDAMRAYLDAMDRARYDAPALETAPAVRVLAALGPRMLALAAERADGAHPYLVPPEHTRRARQILGPTALLCPEVAVVLEPEPDRARRIARAHLATYLRLANYRRNLARIGYGEDDLADAGSDRLVDDVVAWGPLEQATGRVRQHLEAGADHVAVQVLTEDRTKLPLEEWRALATSSLFR